jgi:hypothetical protein
MRKLLTVLTVMLLVAGSPSALTMIMFAAAQATQTPVAAKPTKPPPNAETLDRLLAPIALYPDQLLAQILLCAANPGKVAALNEWLASHQNEKGSALQEAAVSSGFDASFVALVLFPDVVSRMAQQLDWTTQLGQAFAADRSAVFGSIQRLRGQAQKAGTLKDTPQQDVETKTTSSGQQVIVIEPANPQVVYVPQYNPQVVYTQPTSTVVVQQSSSSSDAVAAGLIGFTAGIAIGAAFDNDNYYGPYGWGRGAYMYNDAWDDWADHREDAREDWMDHREDIVEERGDVSKNAQEQRTERANTAQQQRTERANTAQQNRADSQGTAQQRRSDANAAAATGTSTTRSRPEGSAATTRVTPESRGYSGGERATTERSGTRSDAFSNYSSGKSTKAASERGQRSRSSSSRSSGGRRR